MAQHTPGPWKTVKTFGGVTYIMAKDNKSIGILRGYKHPYKANARLMAAAPDLLELLFEAYEESKKGINLCNMPLISHQWHQQTQKLVESLTGKNDGTTS